jgi:hypothetical protein
MLFAELTNVEDDWLWHNGRIGCFGKLAVEEAKDKMENIAGGEEPIAWCG